MTNFQWEMDLLQWFQTIHNPISDKIMAAITSLGDAGIIWIIITLLLFIFCKDKKAAWTSALAMLVSLIVVNCGLKNIVGRDRPCWIDDSVKMLVKIPRDYSFPSGHTATAFASSVSIIQYAKYRKQGIAAVILALAIGVSRMYLFCHWPTDVIAGTILGVLEALLAGIIIRYIYKRIGKLHEKRA